MKMPPIELLEAEHEFPGPFMIKVIGEADGLFLARIVAAVRDELQSDVDPPFRMRSTKSGRHVSITLEPEFESPQQVLATYSRLSQTSGLVMMM